MHRNQSRHGPMLFAGFALAFAFSAAAGTPTAEPAFATPPKASKVGGKVTIEFAVTRETDVAVYIEDRTGKTVCHLAAGVLGKNAPEPFQRGALKQSIVWDGNDNFGKPAATGPFKARVKIGMKPSFDGFLLHNPAASGSVSAVAVGPGGTLHVFHNDTVANGNMGGHKIKVYTRDGKPLKTLLPFPADLTPSQVRGAGVFQTAEGDLVPRVHNAETLSVYPDNVGVRGRDMPDLGASPAVDSKGRVYWLVKGPALVAVNADSSIPYDAFLGPNLLSEVKGLRFAGEIAEYWSEKPSLAVSSDDKYVYFAGLSAGGADFRSATPVSCVYRVDTVKRGPAESFIGKLGQPGNSNALLTAPRGLAVAKGLLYVADPGADRVAVFKEADRSFAGEIKVPSPQSIGVDPASGAVYVCSYTGPQAADLVKFSGIPNPRELCRVALPITGQSPNPGVHRIAVDATARPVLVWVPGIPFGQPPCPLLCIEDAGTKFVLRGDPRDTKTPFADGPRDLSIDRLRDELYVKANGNSYFRIEEKTGTVKEVLNLQIANIGASGVQLVAGTDGNLYTDSFYDGLARLDRSGQNPQSILKGGIMCFMQRSLALRPYAPTEELYRTAFEKFTSVNVFGLDGKPRRTVVWQCMMGATPRLDRWGNIYLADQVKPAGRSYPAFFDGKLKPPPQQCLGGDLYWMSFMYGSIVKFPPSGGAIWSQKEPSKTAIGTPPAELLAKPKIPAQIHFAYSPHFPAEVQGAHWMRFGFSPYSAHTTGNTAQCMCEGSGFDVDPFGRVFFPNLGQFRIEVIDTNNNDITTFGKYGNEDSGGPNAKVKKPEIPLAWPVYVAVSDTHAYVADTVSRRVVRVKLGSADEKLVSIP